MIFRYLGAALILASCGGFGLRIANQCRNEQILLSQMLRCLQVMRWELQYRLTPLPELCRIASRESKGYLKRVLSRLADALEQQLQPDPGSCLNEILQEDSHLPRRLRRLVLLLGKSLGRFDLKGQIQGLEAVEAACQEELQTLKQNGDIRRRNYRTLGFSAGAALVILFL